MRARDRPSLEKICLMFSAISLKEASPKKTDDELCLCFYSLSFLKQCHSEMIPECRVIRILLTSSLKI
jgi:hypothetical protein